MSELYHALARMRGQERHVPDRAVLFRAGDQVRSMFAVAEGAVHLTRDLPHGATLTLQVAGTGSVMAEASLFSRVYHCDATAKESTRLLVIPRAHVKGAMTGNPDFALMWGRHLAGEVQKARARVEIVSLKTVAERLDAHLGLGGELPSRGQFHRLATELNVSPEALYRELAIRRAT